MSVRKGLGDCGDCGAFDMTFIFLRPAQIQTNLSTGSVIVSHATSKVHAPFFLKSFATSFQFLLKIFPTVQTRTHSAPFYFESSLKMSTASKSLSTLSPQRNCFDTPLVPERQLAVYKHTMVRLHAARFVWLVCLNARRCFPHRRFLCLDESWRQMLMQRREFKHWQTEENRNVRE